MVKITIEDVVFWIFILLIIGTALWLLHGSPPESSALITIAIFFAGSELMIWKRIFKIENNFNNDFSKMDKNITVSFMKLRSDFDKNNLMINNRFDKIEEKLNIINNKLKR